MKNAPTGLADLVRAFKVLTPMPADCAAIANLLGLKGNLVFGPAPTASQPEYRVAQPAASAASLNWALESEAEDRVNILRTRTRPRGWQYEPRVEPPAPDAVGRP